MDRNISDFRQKNNRSADDIRSKMLAGIPVREHRLNLAGVSTAVLEGGGGVPIILLHGPGEYAAKWLEIIPDLVKTNRVIAPDLPGHGLSEVIENPFNAEKVLSWLDALIESTCPEPPVLVGQILGGAIAARYSIKHSDRIRLLVLVDALGLARFQPDPNFGRALQEFLMDPSEEKHDQFWNFCAYDLDSLRDRLDQKWNIIKAYNLDRAREKSLQGTQHGLMEQFGMPAIPQEELAQISAPAILIWGRHDLATNVGIAEAASTRYGWPLHVIEGAADDPPLEQPEAFLRALRNLIEKPISEKTYAPRLEDTRRAWDRIAEAFDRTNTRTHMRLGDVGLRRVKIRAGMTFLDVASGSGALSIPAARLGAKVLAVDLSPVMLKHLEKRAHREKLDIETRVMDGHTLSIVGNSFDMAGSQFGVMLFPDMPRGIREMVRVVKPGGRVLIHAYGDPSRIDFLNFFVESIRAARPDFEGFPMNPPPLEFQLASPNRLKMELSSAGLRDVKVETIIESTEFESGDDLWEWIVGSNPIAERILSEMLHLTDKERATVIKTLDKMVRERAGTGSAAMLSSPVNIGIGIK